MSLTMIHHRHTHPSFPPELQFNSQNFRSFYLHHLDSCLHSFGSCWPCIICILLALLFFASVARSAFLSLAPWSTLAAVRRRASGEKDMSEVRTTDKLYNTRVKRAGSGHERGEVGARLWRAAAGTSFGIICIGHQKERRTNCRTTCTAPRRDPRIWPSHSVLSRTERTASSRASKDGHATRDM